MLLVRFWPSYRRDLAEIMKILSLEIAHEIDRDIRQAQARKRENTKTFGRRHTRVTRHMIISPLCHFQAPWRLEQSVYGAYYFADSITATPQDNGIGSPKATQASPGSLGRCTQKASDTYACGMLILNASLYAAAWAI